MRLTHLLLAAVLLPAAALSQNPPAEAKEVGPEKPLPAKAPSCDSKLADCRGAFQASGYLGLAIDNFAAGELTKYLNPEDSGKVLSSRSVFGVDFEWRATGDPELERPKDKGPDGKPKRIQRVRNLWLYGETVHGVRSADVDCKATPNLPSCKAELAKFGANIPESALYILRQATSLEGHAGIRYEFLGLQQQSETPANLYVNAKLGFLSVAGTGGDVVNLSHVGLGAVATRGKFENSHFEVGYGRSDLFIVNPRSRFKVDGYLEIKLPGDIASFFLQMNVDSDLRRGSDSVQSYVGINFDLEKMFGKP